MVAQALDLGAIWLGINPRSGEDSGIITRLLYIPPHIKPFSLVSTGYPAEYPESANRFNEDKIHYKYKA